MKVTFKKILAPFISLALLMLANGFFLTFVSAKLQQELYSPIAIGVIQGSYYAGFLIAALKSEHIIQRIKHIRAFSFFASIATACFLITYYADHIIIWVVMRFVVGICIAGLYVVIESWFFIVSDQKNRGVILGIYMLGIYLSQAASQLIIELVDVNSSSAYIIAGYLAAFSILPVTFTKTTIPDMEVPPPSAIFNFLAIAPLGTIGAVLSGLILGSFFTFGPTYAQTHNYSIAYLMSVTIAGGFLLQYPIGHLSDIFDRRKVVIFVSVMTALTALAIILFAKTMLWLLILSFLLGGFSFTIYPLSISQTVDRCQHNEATKVAGVMLFAYSFGAVIGPLVTPLFISIFKGQVGLYGFIGFASLMLTVIGMFTLGIKKAIPKKDRENFVALPPQTPVVGDLDPRMEVPEEDPSLKS